MVRQHERLAPIIILVSASLGATVSACSKEPTQASSTAVSSGQAQANTFRFAPPAGTHFVRYDKRRQELSIAGAPLRSVTEEELQWNVAIDRSGDKYLVKQDLAHVSFKRDGEVVAEGDVKHKVSAELTIDGKGNLVQVGGLDKTAANLEELAPPEQRAAVHGTLTAKYLGDVVATRYKMFFGDTIGHPAAAGSTWTVKHEPGSIFDSRKVTVLSYEPCDGTNCARLRIDFDVNPQQLANDAVALVRSRVRSLGGDPAKVAVRKASYGMTGTMLVEPGTMLSHGAALKESGSVTIASMKNEELTVEEAGSLEVSYAYGTAPVAARE